MTALAVAEVRRDAGMQVAAEAEAAEQPGFKALAYATILRLAREQLTVHIDDVLAACPVRPRHPNAWGAVWMQAIREGVIVRTGEMRHSTDPRKNKHLYPVYRSLVQGQTAPAEVVSAPAPGTTSASPVVRVVRATSLGDIASYRDLISRKRVAAEPQGFADVGSRDILPGLFPHQEHCLEFALRAGRAAEFLDTGLGKTALALAWGDAVARRTNRPVLMLAPLAVAAQHHAEAQRIGVDARLSRFGAAPEQACVAITNYERLERFNPDDFAGVILDESSILKSFTGSTKRKLVEAFARTPYRLCCTATPAPNDHTELGQHSEFLGVMRPPEMLSRWFIADQANAGRYRLKRPAVRAFWDWVASWARCVSKPSDLGFSDDGFVMPGLDVRRHVVQADRSIDAGEEKGGQGRLFRIPSASATSIHQEKRLTKNERAARVAELVRAEPGESWICWVETDYDADALKALMPEATEVRGSMSIDQKEERLAAFSSGAVRILITKPSIAGFGLNWQHCARMAFMGLSFSYEAFYQAVRRCHRFRQMREVHAHVVCADTEASIWDVVNRKAGDHSAMKLAMSAAMARAAQSHRVLETYDPQQGARLPAWMVP